MRELQSRLANRETATTVEFDALNNRIRCYAHIINICSSHIIASVTPAKKPPPSNLEAARDDSDHTSDDGDSDDSSDDGDSDRGSGDDGSDNDVSDNGSTGDGANDGLDNDDSDDELDDCDVNPACAVDEVSLAECHNVEDNDIPRRWARGVKCDPLSRAQSVIRLLRSSDQRRQGFQDFIKDGNEYKRFFLPDPKKKAKTTAKNRNKKKGIAVEVPQVELLRDVKTRWDSTYLMLQRLLDLRPVSSSR